MNQRSNPRVNLLFHHVHQCPDIVLCFFFLFVDILGVYAVGYLVKYGFKLVREFAPDFKMRLY